MSKKALLIGVVQKLDGSRALDGADGNAWALGKLLRRHYGFAGNDIFLLTSAEETTRESILRGIDRWLVAGAESGDVRVLALSAHGVAYSRGDDTTDFFLTSDMNRNTPGIFQTELGKRLRQLPEGVRLTCLFDTCRPKYLSRNDFLQTLLIVMIRSLLSSQHLAQIGLPGVQGSLVESPAGDARNRAPLIQIKNDQPWVTMKACAEEQSATYDEQGGLFTKALCAVLDSAPEQSPAEAVKRACEEWVFRVSFKQSPEAVGPRSLLHDRAIFT